MLWGTVQMICYNRKEKKKLFQIFKSKKALQRLTKRNKHSKHKKGHISPDIVPAKYSAQISQSSGQKTVHFLNAPPQLDLFGHTTESVYFFAEVLRTVQNCKFGDTIFFDLSSVEIISPDAIMYLIAIIKNMRRIKFLKIICKGNTPKAESARRMIEQSGFFSFVTSVPNRKVVADGRYMKISDGKDANGKLASSFCDFVQRACNQTNLGTKRLYPMIIELMTNTHQHAYDAGEKQIMLGNWYIFAQDTEESVRFVFLDTGMGIPQTVSKRFYEKVKNWIIQDDAMYIKSALLGEFRSETRQGHRGKGLPGIYEDARHASIKNLSIISGKGKCTVDGNNNNIETETFNQAFEGTLFTWEILKGGIAV